MLLGAWNKHIFRKSPEISVHFQGAKQVLMSLTLITLKDDYNFCQLKPAENLCWCSTANNLKSNKRNVLLFREELHVNFWGKFAVLYK